MLVPGLKYHDRWAVQSRRCAILLAWDLQHAQDILAHEFFNLRLTK